MSRIRSAWRGLIAAADAQRQTIRDLAALKRRAGSDGVSLKVDATTRRAEILIKRGSGPIIEPDGVGWRAGAVFDGAPIHFGDRRLIYFCGQPAYRPDAQNFIGLAEWTGDDFQIDDAPVIAPDIEERGVDIPTFTVWNGKIIGVYLDDYGAERTGRGTDANLVLAESNDGRRFEKRIISRPLNGDFIRIGLPWLLADGDRLRLYFRAKAIDGAALALADLDFEAGEVHNLRVVCRIPRNPINVAVTKRLEHYWLLYGATVGGGLYIAPSADGESFNFSREIMAVSSDGEWGWDFQKICPRPDNTTSEDIDLCYLSLTEPMAIAGGSISTRALRDHTIGNT